MAFRDEARFYKIDGREYPSVTTILSVISKPALGPWYAKEERRLFETAILEELAGAHADQPDRVLDGILRRVEGLKAGDRAKQKAGTVGTAAHALIEWHTRRMLGEDPGPEPTVPDAALWAVEAWKDWAKAVDFTPQQVELVVWDPVVGYAGTADTIALVKGVPSLVDYKTGKAIYPESFLQNIAYRHAAQCQGIETARGVILRLPKVEEDPLFEAMEVPESTSLAPFEAALALWRWQRSMNGQRTGR